MRLLKLTGIGHPDIDEGRQEAVFIDPSRILVIERAHTAHLKERSSEEHRQALQQLWEEVQRVNDEAVAMPRTLMPESEHEARQMDRWMSAREASASLNAAYGLVSRALNQPAYHPRIYCTCVQLACGTGLEHGVMLARVFVTETPEEVASQMERCL
jgi:hypothetical protein